MRKFSFENPKIQALLILKGNKTKNLLKICNQIDKVEEDLAKNQRAIAEWSGRAVNQEIEDKIKEGDEIMRQLDELTEKLEKCGRELVTMKMELIPKEIFEQEKELKDKKEKLERERNKEGLAIQKIKDRVNPMIQRIVQKELVGDFEDMDTARLQGKKIVVNIFDHVENYKNEFLKKRNKGVTEMPDLLKEETEETKPANP